MDAFATAVAAVGVLVGAFVALSGRPNLRPRIAIATLCFLTSGITLLVNQMQREARAAVKQRVDQKTIGLESIRHQVEKDRADEPDADPRVGHADKKREGPVVPDYLGGW